MSYQMILDLHARIFWKNSANNKVLKSTRYVDAYNPFRPKLTSNALIQNYFSHMEFKNES